MSPKAGVIFLRVKAGDELHALGDNVLPCVFDQRYAGHLCNIFY